MAQTFSNEQVADTFRQLNTKQKLRVSSRTGIWASWIAIILMATIFLFVALYLIDADRKAEEVQLQQSTELLVQNVESRLLSDSELLQRTGLRLMQLPGNPHRLASTDMAAASFLQDRREVLELWLVNRNYQILGAWTSTSSPEEHNVPQSHTMELPSRRALVDSVFFRDAPLVGEPYSRANHSSLYVDIMVPTPAPEQILVARVNFTRLINDAASVLGHGRYSYTVLKDGQPILESASSTNAASNDFGDGVTYSAKLPMFSKQNLRIESVSYDHEIFTTNNLKLWAIVALTGLLGLALVLLLRNQRLQHRAHQRLSAEYALRVAMQASSVAGVRVTDLNGRIMFANDTFERLTGFSSTELIGSTFPYPWWSRDITSSARALIHDPEDLHVRTIEVPMRRKDGTEFDGLMNISPLRNEQGRTIGWIGELYDITEQKRARDRMKAAHERFTRVVQSMNSAICVINKSPEPQLLFRNSPYENLFGRGASGACRLIKMLNDIPASVSRRGIYDEQTNRWFDARLQYLTWTNDEPAIMLIATDITQQHEMEIALENQLRQAENTQRLVTMGEMASSLAHELNQPLAAISNYATGASFMIGADKLSKDDTLTALGKINKQAQRAAAIIKRIRGFAKKTDAQLISTDPELIVSETMELALIQANKLRCDIRVNIAPELPHLMGDAVMLEQLLLNLLKNAMEAVQPCSNHTIDLNVDLHPDGQMIQFHVIDHGLGISDEHKQQLFDAFFSTKTEGMGMGLNICRSIVEIHKGRIVVTDTPGGGATFTFTVPLARDTDEII